MRRLVFLLVALGLAIAAASASSTTAGTPLSPKLRSDLAALVAGEATLDARIPSLIPGLEAGEIPFFAVLSEPNDMAHRAQLEGLGARVLRTYRSVDAFALVSDAGTVSEVAGLPWVDWLAPIEVVEALTHEAEVDEARNTPADVGAHAFAAGIELHELRAEATGLEDLYFRLTAGQEQFAAGTTAPGATASGATAVTAEGALR
jgi:hypothetical protein